MGKSEYDTLISQRSEESIFKVKSATAAVTVRDENIGFGMQRNGWTEMMYERDLWEYIVIQESAVTLSRKRTSSHRHIVSGLATMASRFLEFYAPSTRSSPLPLASLSRRRFQVSIN